MPLWVTILVLLAGACAPLTGACGDQVIRFPSLDPKQAIDGKGTLVMPEHAPGKVPAVVIVHSTGGVDGTADAYRARLNRAGVATFEVDFKSGVFTSSSDRPEPETFVPLGFAALKLLRANAAIDGDRIGILGFSLGGIVGIESMVDANARRWLGDGKGYAAYVALYPDCRYLLRKLNGEPLQQAPLLVLFGALDSYGAKRFCPELESGVTGRLEPAPLFVMYPQAHHGFDRPGGAVSYDDPWAVNGRGHIEYNDSAAEDSRSRVEAFFKRWLVDTDRPSP